MIKCIPLRAKRVGEFIKNGLGLGAKKTVICQAISAISLDIGPKIET
jgi:hypothetical protein